MAVESSDKAIRVSFRCKDQTKNDDANRNTFATSTWPSASRTRTTQMTPPLQKSRRHRNPVSLIPVHLHQSQSGTNGAQLAFLKATSQPGRSPRKGKAQPPHHFHEVPPTVDWSPTTRGLAKHKDTAKNGLPTLAEQCTKVFVPSQHANIFMHTHQFRRTVHVFRPVGSFQCRRRFTLHVSWPLQRPLQSTLLPRAC